MQHYRSMKSIRAVITTQDRAGLHHCLGCHRCFQVLVKAVPLPALKQRSVETKRETIRLDFGQVWLARYEDLVEPVVLTLDVFNDLGDPCVRVCPALWYHPGLKPVMTEADLVVRQPYMLSIETWNERPLFVRDLVGYVGTLTRSAGYKLLNRLSFDYKDAVKQNILGVIHRQRRVGMLNARYLHKILEKL